MSSLATQLDQILTRMCNKYEDRHLGELNQRYLIYEELKDIADNNDVIDNYLDRLFADGNMCHNNTSPYHYVLITPAGKAFIANGGYTRIENEQKILFNNSVCAKRQGNFTLLIAILTLIATIIGIFISYAH